MENLNNYVAKEINRKVVILGSGPAGIDRRDLCFAGATRTARH